MSTLAALVHHAAAALTAAGLPPDTSRADAEVLARHLLQWDAADWLAHLRDPAPPALRAALDAGIARRARREPVAYITGQREFFGRRFDVTPDVLVPRPETEFVVSEALTALAERRQASRSARLRIADVGTGSGCLAVTLALEDGEVEVVGTDVSQGALRIARRNAERLGVSPQVQFRHAALLDDVTDTYDVVVSNPPYIAERDRDTLMPDVRDYEPALALFGGMDGLDVIRALLPAAARALKPGGWLIVEIGSDQSSAVAHMVKQIAALSLVRVTADLAGHPRVVVVRRCD